MEATKRKKEGAENGDEGQLKRRRLEYNHPELCKKDEAGVVEKSNKAVVSSCSPQKFISFHLRILESLYDTENNNRFSSNSGGFDAPSVSSVGSETWASIQSFLENRDDTLKSKAHASRWNWISRKASILGDEQLRSVSPGSKSITPRSPPTRLFQTTQLSAASPTKKQERAPFRIVAKILGSHAKEVQTTMQQRVVEFKTLLNSTRQHVAELREASDSLRKKLAEVDQKAVKSFMKDKLIVVTDPTTTTDESIESDKSLEEKQSTLLELKTKIQLWTLLAENLEQVC